MSKMQDLELSTNDISGTLPVDWGQLGAFPGLTTLYLDDNQLTGEWIPGAGINLQTTKEPVRQS